MKDEEVMQLLEKCAVHAGSRTLSQSLEEVGGPSV